MHNANAAVYYRWYFEVISSHLLMAVEILHVKNLSQLYSR